MAKFLYTTFFCGSSPLTPYLLSNGIWLYPGIRKELLKAVNSQIICDSTYFIAQDISEDEFQSRLEKFLIFHSFITGDPLSIETYELDLTDEIHTVEVNTLDDLINMLPISPSRAVPFDYSNIGQLLFTNFDKENSPVISFNELYQKFLDLKDEKQHLIYLHTYNTKRGSKRIERAIYKTEYLDISLHFTIIEALVTKSDRYCSNKISYCDTCGKSNIQHEKQSIKEIIKGELKRLILTKVIYEGYSDCIDAAHYIRNKVYHYAEMDKAKKLPKNLPIFVYNASFSAKNYKKDKEALTQLCSTVKILSRSMILKKYFELNYFPMPPQHIFITLNDSIKSEDIIRNQKK